MRQERRRGTRLPYEYYEEVRIMPDECLSQPGTAMGVGPGLCGTSENASYAKFAEFLFHALR
jgi:hypothetical protein